MDLYNRPQILRFCALRRQVGKGVAAQHHPEELSPPPGNTGLRGTAPHPSPSPFPPPLLPRCLRNEFILTTFFLNGTGFPFRGRINAVGIQAGGAGNVGFSSSGAPRGRHGPRVLLKGPGAE